MYLREGASRGRKEEYSCPYAKQRPAGQPRVWQCPAGRRYGSGRLDLYKQSLNSTSLLENLDKHPRNSDGGLARKQFAGARPSKLFTLETVDIEEW